MSPDADILVFCVHHFEVMGIKELYIKTGGKGIHTDFTKYIPVHTIHKSLSDDRRNIMLQVYCITGCDTCCAFYGTGKKTAFNVRIKDCKRFQSMKTLGDSQTLSTSETEVAMKFVSVLYGDCDCGSLNEIRTKKVKGKPRNLPPTDDAFFLHLR